MSTRHRIRLTGTPVACAAVATILAASCGRSPSTQAAGGTGDAAEKVYVAPGQYDEFYAFVSGGFSGNMPRLRACPRAGCSATSRSSRSTRRRAGATASRPSRC